MSPYSYVPLTDNSLTCAHTGELCISVKKEHLLIHRSDHTCALAIYYQMDSLTKAMHCKDKHAINLKSYPTFPDLGDLILLSNPPGP